LLTLLLSASTIGAQTRPFVYSLIPAPDGVPATGVYTDIAYGHDVFAALGPEAVEQRLAMQRTLSPRFTITAQTGWAPQDDNVRSNVSAQVELLGNIGRSHSPLVLAVGAGAMRDYTGTGVALGRVVAGYRGARTLAVANLRLEHAFTRAQDQRDALDVITTVGATRDIASGIRLGVESVAEDLEGFVEADEAEGGAKLMIGPTIGIGMRRWTMQLTAGPVFHLTGSSYSGSGSGAPRDLSRPGYVARSAFGFNW
jgi:hypothetical protein